MLLLYLFMFLLYRNPITYVYGMTQALLTALATSSRYVSSYINVLHATVQFGDTSIEHQMCRRE